MSGWHPIDTAPRDGTRIIARRNPEDVGGKGRVTWFGKTSHVPLYGWCIGTDPENIDLWRPDEWRPRKVKP